MQTFQDIIKDVRRLIGRDETTVSDDSIGTDINDFIETTFPSISSRVLGQKLFYIDFPAGVRAVSMEDLGIDYANYKPNCVSECNVIFPWFSCLSRSTSYISTFTQQDFDNAVKNNLNGLPAYRREGQLNLGGDVADVGSLVFSYGSEVSNDRELFGKPMSSGVEMHASGAVFELERYDNGKYVLSIQSSLNVVVGSVVSISYCEAGLVPSFDNSAGVGVRLEDNFLCLNSYFKSSFVLETLAIPLQKVMYRDDYPLRADIAALISSGTALQMIDRYGENTDAATRRYNNRLRDSEKCSGMYR